jgi:integrase
MVKRFRDSLLRNGKSANTVRNNVNLVKGIFGTAIDSGAVRTSPAARVELPKPPKHEHTYLDHDEVARLAECIGAAYGLLVMVAAYGGPRFGELAALRRRDVDLLQREPRLHIRRSVTEVDGRSIMGSRKSGRDRVVTLPAPFRSLLQDFMSDRGIIDEPDGLVFSASDVSALRRSKFYRRIYKPAVRAAGLPESLRFHDLCHTCAALSVAAGAHALVIKERLGHASITTTLDTNGHLLPSLESALLGALETSMQEAKKNEPRPHRGQAG